jgi:hypothetical protein
MRIDSKGKYYTPRITTEELHVLILTNAGVIDGHVHIHPGRRLSDEFNDELPFIAITEASIHDKDGAVVHQAHFISLNKREVIWVIPVDALHDGSNPDNGDSSNEG